MRDEVKSVGLVGDGDDVDMLEGFERSFQVCFTDAEAGRILTLGNVYEQILKKLRQHPSNPQKCRSAMAYYRLNGALTDKGKLDLNSKVRPREGQSARKFQRELVSRSGLNLDVLTTDSRWVFPCFGLILSSSFVAVLAPFGAFVDGAAIALVLAALFALYHSEKWDRGYWVFGGSLAELSKLAADTNIGMLVLENGSWNPDEVWTIMTAIIEEANGLPAAKMKPEMTFF